MIWTSKENQSMCVTKMNFQTKSRKERVLPMHQKLFKTFSKPENGYCFMNNNKKLGKESTTRLFTEITKSIKLKT